MTRPTELGRLGSWAGQANDEVENKLAGTEDRAMKKNCPFPETYGCVFVKIPASTIRNGLPSYFPWPCVRTAGEALARASVDAVPRETAAAAQDPAHVPVSITQTQATQLVRILLPRRSR
jgi:hypothetical protein